MKNTDTSIVAGCTTLFAVESLETRTMLSGQVIALSLIDAPSGQGLLRLRDNMVVNLRTLGSDHLDLRARIRGKIDAVRLNFDGQKHLDKTSSYTWRYNSAKPWTPEVGEHVFKATTIRNGKPSSRPAVVRFTIIDEELPDTPRDLKATALSVTSVELTWNAVDTPNAQIRILRSVDGGEWGLAAILGSEATSFTDENLEVGQSYAYQIRTRSIAGRSPASPSVHIMTQGDVDEPNETMFEDLSQEAIDFAIAHPLIRYNRYIAGGAHTNQPANGGAPIALALASYIGNTTADARLLEQIRYTLTPGNEITANGGYPAQHERIIETAFIFARQTPRIWDQLSELEQHKIDLIMKAAFVASAFTTGDNNPYILANSTQYGLDGNNALSRTWNPNYREGMIGGVLVGIGWLGGAASAGEFLLNYNHADFTTQLQEANLPNLHQTFNWKIANPTSTAPDGATIETAIRDYRYYGMGLDDPMGIFAALTFHTFGKTVSPGLNYGIGFNGAGKILTGADTLPNLDQLGMLAEFNSNDANGARSSARYAYDGFRTHMANHLVMLLTGMWDENHPSAAEMNQRMAIGATDLWYKLDHGYSNYAKGVYAGTMRATDKGEGFEVHRPLWEDVVRPLIQL